MDAQDLTQEAYEPDWDHPIYSQEPAPPAVRAPVAVSPSAAPPHASPLDSDAPPWDEPARAVEADRLDGPTDTEDETAKQPAVETPMRTALPDRKEFLIPALMSRSALFSAGTGAGQQAQPERVTACYSPYALRLEGPRLTMRDKAVWECFLRAAFDHGFADEQFVIAPSGIARALGGSGTSRGQRASLKALGAWHRRASSTNGTKLWGQATW